MKANNYDMMKRIEKLEDNMYYEEGEIETISKWYCGGTLTNATKGLRFAIVLPKRVKPGFKATLLSGTITVRRVEGGYLLNGTSILDCESINAAYLNNNILPLLINYQEAFDTVNNTPIGVEINDLQIQFTKQ